MFSNLWIALQITFIGMGLVFASIILLWGLMALLVRLTTDRPALIETSPVIVSGPKQQAAVAAVAVALAISNQKPPPLAPPPTAIVSTWQAVMRANQLKQRGPVRR